MSWGPVLKPICPRDLQGKSILEVTDYIPRGGTGGDIKILEYKWNIDIFPSILLQLSAIVCVCVCMCAQ